MIRTAITLAAMAIALVLGQDATSAQGFPQRTIHIVVPYGPGGLPDLLARVVGQKMTENTGHQVVVDNKSGGSGIIGARYFLSRAEADGHTIFLIDNNTDAINAAVYPNLPYNPSTDFASVAQAVQGYMYLVANPSAGINSVGELIASAKAKPGGINYGSPGIATLHHLGMEQLAMMAGVKLTHVPFRGVAQATPGLLRGDVAVMFASLASVSSSVEAGTLRLLAVGSARQSALTPEVPTVAGEGYPGFTVATNMGFAVRADTPRTIIKQLNAELVTALKSPDVISRIEALGVGVLTGTPEEFAAELARDREVYSRLARDIDLKLN